MVGTNRFISKVLLITQIAAMVLYPKRAIRSGAMNSEDIRNFPPKLLKQLKINITLLLAGFTWFVTACAYVKFNHTY